MPAASNWSFRFRRRKTFRSAQRAFVVARQRRIEGRIAQADQARSLHDDGRDAAESTAALPSTATGQTHPDLSV
jgi:hypothetical protein